MYNPTIETERLILRTLQPDDAQDLYEMDSNPKVHIYLGNNPMKSLEEVTSNMHFIQKQYDTFGIGRLAMIKKDTNEFVGWAGLKYEQQLRKEFNYYDLGYRLKEKFWGNGYATEAAIASLKHGFDDLKLKEVCAAADVNHVVSNKILKNIGLEPSGPFTYEGSLCNWYALKNPNV